MCLSLGAKYTVPNAEMVPLFPIQRGSTDSPVSHSLQGFFGLLIPQSKLNLSRVDWRENSDSFLFIVLARMNIDLSSEWFRVKQFGNISLDRQRFRFFFGPEPYQVNFKLLITSKILVVAGQFDEPVGDLFDVRVVLFGIEIDAHCDS